MGFGEGEFNMYPGEKNLRWNSTRLPNPRVSHYWDMEKIVGRWLVDRKVIDYPHEALWDAYLLFKREAIWDAKPQSLTSWGMPVYPNRKGLAETRRQLKD